MVRLFQRFQLPKRLQVSSINRVLRNIAAAGKEYGLWRGASCQHCTTSGTPTTVTSLVTVGQRVYQQEHKSPSETAGKTGVCLTADV